MLGGGLIICIIACAAAGLALIAQGEVNGLITVALGAGVPLCIFAMAIKRDQLILDAHTRTATVQRRTLFSYGSATYALDNVRRAEVEDLSDTARPTLTFHDATPAYPLMQTYISGNGPRQAAEAINSWLLAQRRS